MLPKPYLSYSQYALWKSNKDAYRRRYYEGEKSIDTPETLYGKKIGTLLEDPQNMADVPRYSVPEHKIEVPMFGTILHGRLDSFDPMKNKFLEFKTGHTDCKGKAPWDKVKVAKHIQLVFYSLLIKLKYGKVDPVCHLIWLETEWVKDTETINGRVVPRIGRSNELQLTGKVKKFSRRIYEWERKKLLFDLKVVVAQIEKDYEEYKNNKVQVWSNPGLATRQD